MEPRQKGTGVRSSTQNFGLVAPKIRICVFCGARDGTSPKYLTAARVVGELLADWRIPLVYGGSSRGLMGGLAAAVVERGGEISGVMPRSLADSEAVLDTGGVCIVDSMHERKATMYARADAYVALPGGIGTLDELFEIWTWSQLGLHTKPCGILNIDGFFDHMLRHLDHCVAEGFIASALRHTLLVSSEPEELIRAVVHASDPQYLR